MLWMLLVAAFAAEPAKTSADDLMPVFLARLDIATAEADLEAANGLLTEAREQRKVVLQREKTAKQLAKTAEKTGDDDGAKKAADRLNKAATDLEAADAAIAKAEQAVDLAKADRLVADLRRRYEIARASAALEADPKKREALAAKIPRAQERLREAQAFRELIE